jgi:hypothetical protein
MRRATELALRALAGLRGMKAQVWRRAGARGIGAKYARAVLRSGATNRGL